jgi:flagellar basal body-associated protein FliL
VFEEFHGDKIPTRLKDGDRDGSGKKALLIIIIIIIIIMLAMHGGWRS